MDYVEVNRRNWDERARVHASSQEYGLERFHGDPAFLSDVVRYDQPRLGDIAGQRVVHLQCHIGTDTLSLARLGAQVTGLDLSGESLRVARDLAGGAVEYVQAEVYQAREVLEGQFDLVYTGIGALCWLPDVHRWAQVVASLLRPGGRLFIREGHPVLWAMDYDTPGELRITYPYFTTTDPIVETVPTSYAGTDQTIANATTHSWNHGLAEIVTALLDNGMTLTALEEHRSVPWNPFPAGMMRQGDLGEFFLIEHPERLPLTYTLQALKR
ncbi:MAG: class I SAM-dependent methyltransferase [Candidatus Nanopelagicales bacterium]